MKMNKLSKTILSTVEYSTYPQFPDTKIKKILMTKILFKEKNISTIVVGYPLFLDGGFSPRCKSILDFCEGLLKLENIDIYLQDERFSTNFVKNNLKKIDKKNNYHDSIDSKSASWFLQIFIDKLKNKI